MTLALFKSRNDILEEMLSSGIFDYRTFSTFKLIVIDYLFIFKITDEETKQEIKKFNSNVFKCSLRMIKFVPMTQEDISVMFNQLNHLICSETPDIDFLQACYKTIRNQIEYDNFHSVPTVPMTEDFMYLIILVQKCYSRVNYINTNVSVETTERCERLTNMSNELIEEEVDFDYVNECITYAETTNEANGKVMWIFINNFFLKSHHISVKSEHSSEEESEEESEDDDKVFVGKTISELLNIYNIFDKQFVEYRLSLKMKRANDYKTKRNAWTEYQKGPESWMVYCHNNGMSGFQPIDWREYLKGPDAWKSYCKKNKFAPFDPENTNVYNAWRSKIVPSFETSVSKIVPSFETSVSEVIPSFETSVSEVIPSFETSVSETPDQIDDSEDDYWDTDYEASKPESMSIFEIFHKQYTEYRQSFKKEDYDIFNDDYFKQCLEMHHSPSISYMLAETNHNHKIMVDAWIEYKKGPEAWAVYCNNNGMSGFQPIAWNEYLRGPEAWKSYCEKNGIGSFNLEDTSVYNLWNPTISSIGETSFVDKTLTAMHPDLRFGEMEREAIKYDRENYTKFVGQLERYLFNHGRANYAGFPSQLTDYNHDYEMCTLAWIEYKKGRDNWDIYCQKNNLVGFIPEDVGVNWE